MIPSHHRSHLPNDILKSDDTWSCRPYSSMSVEIKDEIRTPSLATYSRTNLWHAKDQPWKYPGLKPSIHSRALPMCQGGVDEHHNASDAAEMFLAIQSKPKNSLCYSLNMGGTLKQCPKLSMCLTSINPHHSLVCVSICLFASVLVGVKCNLSPDLNSKGKFKYK